MSVSAVTSLNFIPAAGAVDAASVELLQRFVSRARRLFVVSGAGLSTESGIPDYRSEGVGLYARTDRRPMQYQEFVRSATSRQRYWARNYLGWPRFSSHKPNAAHRSLRRWEEMDKLHWLVTQNVDSLHSKAGQRRLTELHGCAHRYTCVCLSCCFFLICSSVKSCLMDVDTNNVSVCIQGDMSRLWHKLAEGRTAAEVRDPEPCVEGEGGWRGA